MNNSTTYGDSSLFDTHSLRVMRLSIYPIVFVLGFAGNSAVFFLLLCRRKYSRSISSTYILNLAVADTIVLIIFLPFDLAYLENNWKWKYSVFMCKFINSISLQCITVSASTLIAISYDRYKHICFPLRKKVSQKHVNLTIVFIWVYSFLVGLPFTLALDISENEECVIDLNWWASYDAMKLSYIFLIFLPEFILPALCISIFYSKIVIFLRRYQRTVVEKTLNINIATRRAKQNKKTIKLLSALILLYAICILPYQIITLVVIFNEQYLYSQYVREVYEFTRLITSFNCCLNPVLYGTINRDLRADIVDLFRRKFYGHSAIAGSRVSRVHPIQMGHVTNIKITPRPRV